MEFVFYQPTQSKPADAPMALLRGGGLTAVAIRPGTEVRLGLFGAGFNGDLLEVHVYHHDVRVNRPGGRVVVTRTSADKARRLQEFVVYGLKQGDVLVGVSASARPMTDRVPVYEVRNTPSGVMRAAADASPLLRWSFPGVCPDATPYLALTKAGAGPMPELSDATAGRPIQKVRGLSVHTTAGTDARSAYDMARWGCIAGWNRDGVSAHFGVSGDGTLVQYLPVTVAAYAQYSPGNEHWVSLEVDNSGQKPMTDPQLAAARTLYRWLAAAYRLPRTVATGGLYKNQGRPDLDAATKAVCDRADVPTTHDPYEAVMSEGVSCHWWLDGKKVTNSHVCPGAGILNQLDLIARG